MSRLDPGHGQQQSASSPDSAMRKKRRWPWIVGGVFGALVVLGVIGNAVDPTPKSEQTTASPASSAAPPAAPARSSVAAPNAVTPSAPARSAQPDWRTLAK